jgi:hypothetical protein
MGVSLEVFAGDVERRDRMAARSDIVYGQGWLYLTFQSVSHRFKSQGSTPDLLYVMLENRFRV